ncbi:UNKNOWN [Stylonychia lemnae]|uniref:Uncharacterized protein n=1 Tax=Stylonychia lemnae TaxID=5949 RepID=A0A078AA63_STYLE|nr:UNKNOWN [Stylonychia lemnae]|eukprot:CDW79079.1 UNKNOWN [Stylonychia lemnae]
MSILKHLPKRGLFQFSNQEYKSNIKNTLASSQRKYKLLKYKNLDDSECKINVYGIPIIPSKQSANEYTSDNEQDSQLFRDMERNLPQLQIVQIDPMWYMYHCRQFSIKYLPSIKDQFQQGKLGIFGKDHKLPFEDQKGMPMHEQKSLEKIFSLYFPFNWTETEVSVDTLMLLADPENLTPQRIKKIQEFDVTKDECQQERELLLKGMETKLISNKYPSIFHDLNRVLLEILMLNENSVLLADMPELLNRMQIASVLSLKEMQEIFDVIMNKIARKQGPLQSGAAAMYHFPEIFLKRKDQYLESFMRSVIEDDVLINQNIRHVDAYIGNIHLSPVSRIWNTNKSRRQDKGQSNIDRSQEEDVEQTTGGRAVKHQLKKSVKPNPLNLAGQELRDFHYMRQNFDELAEEKIEKQALMEALFQTQLWSEPYVKNPFIYITDNDSDFAGDKGKDLLEMFKRVFYLNYQKYNNIIQQVVPQELWEGQRRAQMEFQQNSQMQQDAGYVNELMGKHK